MKRYKKLSLQQQVARMKAIVMKDADARGAIIREDGTMCALGGLAHYGAGISKATLRRWTQSSGAIGKAFKYAQRAFPILTIVGALPLTIYGVNDVHDNIARRREALCRLFDQMLDKALAKAKAK